MTIKQTAGRDQLGSFAPAFAHYNDDVLFGENWNDEGIDLKTRSLLTVITLMAQGITDSLLAYHIANAKAHGVTREEFVAAVTHAAFYAGWPKAWATSWRSQRTSSTGMAPAATLGSATSPSATPARTAATSGASPWMTKPTTRWKIKCT